MDNHYTLYTDGGARGNPGPAATGAQDTTTAINDQLGEIDLNNLDGEFSEIDKDLQSL